MNPHLKSFLLGLSGLLFGATGYIVTWANGQDFGIWTAIVSSMVPVLVNAIRIWIEGVLADDKAAKDDLDFQEAFKDLPAETSPGFRKVMDSIDRLKEIVREPDEPPRDPDTGAFSGLLLVAFLLLPATASAQFASDLPRAIIQGPTAAIPGEMVILDASQSDRAERFRWTITPELKGRKQLLEIDGGKRCQVATYGGRYVITLAVSNASGIDLLTWDLTIAGQPPCPPPSPPTPPVPDDDVPTPPGPVPPPPKPVDPVTPKPIDPPAPKPVQPPDNGRFSLAPEVFRIASTAASATRAEDCLRLASECERIAAASWDGMTPMAAEIVRVLNTLPAGWQELKTRTQIAIAGLYSNGLIKSRDDIAALLRELKVAFERAAQVK